MGVLFVFRQELRGLILSIKLYQLALLIGLSMAVVACGGTSTDTQPAPETSQVSQLEEDVQPPTPGAEEETQPVPLLSGRLDESFSEDGVLVFNSGFKTYNDDTGNAIVIDASGRILVAGYTHNATGNFDTVLIRFTAEGVIDTTFGYDYDFDSINDGFAVYDRGIGSFRSDVANDIEIDSNDRILLTGYSENGVDTDLILMRYNSNGRLDLSFGTNGIVILNNIAGGNGQDYGKALSLDGSGNILVAGSSTNAAGNIDLVICRFLADGTLDATFGGNYNGDGSRDGYVIHNNAAGGNGNDSPAAIAIDTTGRIVVAGASLGTGHPVGYTDDDIVVWRFTSDGVLDTTFGQNYDGDSALDGYIKVDGPVSANSYDLSSDIKISADGSIVVLGSSYSDSTSYDMVVWSFTSNGDLNNLFGNDYNMDTMPDGFVHYAESDTQVGMSFDFDATGNIVITGYNGLYELATWRYTSDGQRDQTYGDDGVKIYANHPVNGRGHQMVLDDDGKIVITGLIITGGEDAHDLAVWRLIP